MREQKYIKQLIDKLLSGTINQSELVKLKELIQHYPEYADVFQAHNFISNIQFPAEDPTAENFAQMRQEVLGIIRSNEKNTRSDFLSDTSNWFRAFLMRPEMAVAAITLLVGFFLGRIAPVDEESISSGIMKQISFLARENTNFADSKNSPYQYSNIAFREINNQEIALSFDVSTHIEMVREKNDPLVREVIAQSLLNPTNLGTELKAISYSENMLDNKIKEALIFSMHNAPILAVRMNAMQNLTKYKQDEDVKSAFLKVLSDEESVKMRLTALDYFSENKIETDKIKSLIESSDMRKSPAVWIKAKKYVEEN
jgi:hypothetical protein